MTMTDKKGCYSPMKVSKVINFVPGQLSDAGVKAIKETNFEFQETLEVYELVCIRPNGRRTLYDSLEGRHPGTLASETLLESQAVCQHGKLSSKSFPSLVTLSVML